VDDENDTCEIEQAPPKPKRKRAGRTPTYKDPGAIANAFGSIGYGSYQSESFRAALLSYLPPSNSAVLEQ
jgi:hypothetical protein